MASFARLTPAYSCRPGAAPRYCSSFHAHSLSRLARQEVEWVTPIVLLRRRAERLDLAAIAMWRGRCRY